MTELHLSCALPRACADVRNACLLAGVSPAAVLVGTPAGGPSADQETPARDFLLRFASPPPTDLATRLAAFGAVLTQSGGH